MKNVQNIVCLLVLAGSFLAGSTAWAMEVDTAVGGSSAGWQRAGRGASRKVRCLTIDDRANACDFEPQACIGCAGILPYARVEGVYYFLLGCDATRFWFSSFGGKHESVSDFEGGYIRGMKDLLRIFCKEDGSFAGLMSREKFISSDGYKMYFFDVTNIGVVPGGLAAVTEKFKKNKACVRKPKKIDVEWVSMDTLLALATARQCETQIVLAPEFAALLVENQEKMALWFGQAQ